MIDSWLMDPIISADAIYGNTMFITCTNKFKKKRTRASTSNSAEKIRNLEKESSNHQNLNKRKPRLTILCFELG
jgi:hypothetical protein